MSITVLYGDAPVVTANAREDREHLWLSAEDFQASSGWAHHPEGLCRGDACVPLGGDWVDADGRIDLTAFAGHFDQPVVHDAERSVWAVGVSARQRGDDLLSSLAPDFTLPDLDGRMHSLSDYRGKKVFLHTYGSYCGCGFDLPVWQVLYEELRDQGLMIIAVALDTGGAEAVRNRVLAPDLADRPATLRRLMGWPQDMWSRATPPTYPCLIDEAHLLADLYHMTNVPMAVWIDEDGRIIRPSEAAGLGEGLRGVHRQTFEPPAEGVASLASNRRIYLDALRDWVRNGADSSFALSPEDVRDRMRLPAPDDVRAATHARMGRHLLNRGDHEGAKYHFREAVRLAPGKWNYFRQSMVLDPDRIGSLNDDPEFFDAMENSGDGQFYPAIDMPGIIKCPESSSATSL